MDMPERYEAAEAATQRRRPAARWRWRIILVPLAALTMAQAQQAPRASPDPDGSHSQGLEESTVREQQRLRGWVEVDEHKASTIDRAFELPAAGVMHEPSVEPLMSSLRLVPASLRGTMLDRATLQGVRTAGGFVDGGWTGLVRLFAIPGLGRAVLEEYDYVAAGSRFRIPEQTVDSYVNGYPMIFRVYRAPTGKAYTEFAWFTGTKHFRLMIDGQIAQSSDVFAEIRSLMEALA